MTQLQSMETGLENLNIKLGDVIRLLQPFKPELYGFQEYAFGLVVGVIKDGYSRNKKQKTLLEVKETAEKHQSNGDEVVIYLFEPDSSTIYTDRHGVKALFSFDFGEVELY